MRTRPPISPAVKNSTEASKKFVRQPSVTGYLLLLIASLLVAPATALAGGVTIITHGFKGFSCVEGYPGWLDTMATAIDSKLYATNHNAAISRFVVKVRDPNLSGAALQVSAQFLSGANPTELLNENPELVIVLDWSQVASWCISNPLGFETYHRSSVEVADATAAFLLRTDAIPSLARSIVEQPIHIIGFSRGGSVATELARALGQRGVWIDHLTTLDPHPVDGACEVSAIVAPDWDDAIPFAFSNVVFFDNYFRDSCYPPGLDPFDVAGMSVSGALNTVLPEPILEQGGYSYLSSPQTVAPEHYDVHLWYHGTIDTGSSAYDGAKYVPSSWYPTNTPFLWPRFFVGYNRSRIARGTPWAGDARAGYHQGLGGLGSRVGLNLGAATWPSIMAVHVDNGQQFSPGQQIHAHFWYQDVDSNATASYYLDKDQNPYNGNYATLLAADPLQRTFANGQPSGPWDDGAYAAAPDVSQGQYWVLVKVTDGTHTRYSYAYEPVTIIPTPPPCQGTDFQLTSASWDDSGSSPNDGDGIMEAGESPRVRIQLLNAGNQTLSQVSAVITTAPNDYNVYNSDAYFDSFSPGQYRWTNDSFGIDLNFTLPNCNPRIDTLIIRVSYNRGTQPCYQELQTSRPIYKDGCFQAAFNVPSFTIDDSPTIRAYNNGNGILESGEKVHVKPRLCNGGTALATDIVARISSDDSCVEPISPSDWEHYPDMSVGACGNLASDDYFVAQVDKGCCGPTKFNLHTTTDQHPTEQTVADAFTINVGCAPWVGVTESYGFGVVAPNTPISFNAEVRNIGSANLHVTGIVGQKCDGSATNDVTVNAPTSFTVAPGQTRTITVNLNTAGLLGQVCRHVIVQSDGRLGNPGQGDRLVLSGLVANTVPVQQIPNVSNADDCDISGSLIVWKDNRFGNGDIFGYDVLTRQEFQICADPMNQTMPFVSGRLVAWEDDRNGIKDIYAKDLDANQEFAVSTNPAFERLIGVDGNLIAVARRYVVLQETAEEHDLYNIIVYEYLGGDQVIIKYASSFSANTQHQPMLSYSISSDQSDLGGHFLVLNRFENWWNSTYWDRRSYKTQIIDFSAGETSPRDAVSRQLHRIAAGEHRFAYQYDWAQSSSDYLIQMWHSTGQVENVVPVYSYQGNDCNPGKDFVAFGGTEGSEIFVFDYDCSQLRAGIYFRDRATPTEGLLSEIDGESSRFRMDGYGAVWASSPGKRIAYAYFKQPEIAVAWGNPPFSNSSPIEGQSVGATVIARNISTQYGATGNITIRLFLGDPDSGGVQVGTDQVIGGGLAAGVSQSITFNNVIALPVASGDEQSFQYFAKVWSNAIDNPDNNKSACTLLVRDNDTQSPQFVAFGVVEHLGNGDGVISDTELGRVYWSIDDASGIASVQVRVDNGAPTISQDANGFLIIGPLTIADHEIRIAAEDADLTPASASRTINFLVDACPNDPDKLAPGLCGCGAVDSTVDSDSDAILDCLDTCPQDALNDVDADGVCGNVDNCPPVPNSDQLDTDGDHIGDLCDGCPNDGNKIAPGTCGCGVADTDSDGDGTANCNDGCPNDASKIAPGTCGCGVADTDSDGDGTANCNDGCPFDEHKTEAGACGCGSAETDGDGDGHPDCVDNCPTIANADQADADGDGIGDLCEEDTPGGQPNPDCGAQGTTCGMGTIGLMPLGFVMMRMIRPTRRSRNCVRRTPTAIYQ